ncbi:alpha/beta hydrolase fold domain-containing protein [Leucobacter sp. CSA2]|uniref:Alpha/beta hydrolase fold domain-containing protein n=2 Tax=Leucobacter edaphi TaxID=2796472 RepID=A0A934QD64_9MICO|nr:alpha/beta hydrolase fold domain-containing protein [Leucobacter edaphi]MBK0422445.1 alpha/beta hydrolase fold domain-containing protein [Leucobacter edaphi]
MRAVVEHQLDRAAALRADGADQATDGTLAEDPRPGPNGAALIAAARSEYLAERAFWNQGGPRMHETRDFLINAAGTEVPVRMHRPGDARVLPAIVFLHGGGFTLGNLDSHDRIARVLAEASGAAVIAVDYTLSPEARFPQALHECAGVIARLALDGERYGLDGGRLAVAGDSAGAALSLGSALLLRDEPDRVPEAAADPDRVFASLRAMLLYYGAYGLANSSSRASYGGFWDGMSSDDLGSITDTYLSKPADRKSPYASPLTADLDAALPPALIIGAELDPLRDDSEALATRLEAAGHEVEWEIVPGVLHSFLHFGRMLDEAGAALTRGAEFARDRLAE